MAEADEWEVPAWEASFGNNRGGRGHVGRDGPVVVTTKGEVLAGVRLAGGNEATEKTVVTTGVEYENAAW